MNGIVAAIIAAVRQHLVSGALDLANEGLALLEAALEGHATDEQVMGYLRKRQGAA